jgi:hypothetical protein
VVVVVALEWATDDECELVPVEPPVPPPDELDAAGVPEVVVVPEVDGSDPELVVVEPGPFVEPGPVSVPVDPVPGEVELEQAPRTTVATTAQAARGRRMLMTCMRRMVAHESPKHYRTVRPASAFICSRGPHSAAFT